MISYELAKQLKEAGFSQDLKPWDDIYPFENDDGVHKNATPYQRKASDTEIKIPTLSELIEETEDQFGSNEDDSKEYILFERYGMDKWVCCSNYKGVSEWSLIGDSLEEAVAKLWLELNKKS